jgi:hypothetical protein
MARLSHVITLESVPRRWFDQCVAMTHETFASLRPEGDGLITEDGRTVSAVRLVEGRHATPGARYALGDASGNLVVSAWNPRAETAIKVEIDDEMHIAFDGTLRPSRLNAGGVTALKQYKRLSGLSWNVAAELDRWWGDGRGAAPITASAKHMFAVARATVSQRPAADGRWAIMVVVKLRGRSVFWPFVALGMLFAKGKMQKSFEEALGTFAAEWNEEVPPLLRKSSDELRAMLIDAIADEPTGGDPT